MSDTYQAVYDAVRSKIGSFDGNQLAQEIAFKFDFSHEASMIKDGFLQASYQQGRPSVNFRPKLTMDGNQWCALYGEDLQDGIAGFGDTAEEAMSNFDNNWHNFKASKKEERNKKSPEVIKGTLEALSRLNI